MGSNEQRKAALIAELRAEAAAWTDIARHLSLRLDRDAALARAAECDAQARRLEGAERGPEQP